MADKPAPKAPKPGFHAEFGWFIWGLVGLGFLWAFMGGYSRIESRQPYIKPAAPLDSGQTYGKTYEVTPAKSNEELDLPKAPAAIVRSIEETLRRIFVLRDPTSKTISIDGIGGARETDVQKEYLTLLASDSNRTSILLTGLRLRGTGYGVTTRIPQATNLPILATPYEKSDIKLAAGDRVIVTSGSSPIGTSFQVNICSGYLGQFQTYTPALAQNCPNPIEELETSAASNESACRAFVETLAPCRAYSGSFPSNISASCKAFVMDKLSYNSCVVDHSSDKGFYVPEWRVFLGQESELWKSKQETIRLLGDEDKALDTVSY